MPLNSVNTNVGAQIALQSLNQTNTELGTVQSRINTGKKINSAKDNGAIWAIAQSQRAESQGINSVKESLQRAVSTVDVAMSAGEAVSDLLLKMKEKALSASDTGLSADSRTALAKDYESLRNQINTVVSNASFNGVNMLKGSDNTVVTDAGTGIKALATAQTTAPVAPATVSTIATIDVAGVNFQFDPAMAAGAAQTQLTSLATFNDAPSALEAVAKVEADIKFVSTKLSALGTGSNALSSHNTFMSKLQDSLDAGVGDLVDADLAKESARLQALQTKQQLGVQALSIANQSSGIVLGLFR